MKRERYIRVRVTTSARKESIQHSRNDLWNIAVKEKAERGAANTRVRQLLSQKLGCSEKELRLIKGTTMPSKTFLLTNSTDHEN